MKKLMEILKSYLRDPLLLHRWEDKWYSPKQENQLSVRINRSYRKRSFYDRGSSFMFIEDMHNGIMPFLLYSGEREKYPTRVEPDSPEKKRLIADGISGSGYHHSLADSLCEFVRKTTQILVHDGVVFYEIVYDKDPDGSIASFHLERVDPFYLIKLFNNYFQFIPWWEAKKSRIKVQLIKIQAEKILRIDFPKQYGGRKKLKYILKRLWILGKEVIPKFQMDAMGEYKNIGFDLKEFSRNKYLEIAEITKDIGWDQRNYSNEYTNEYYSMTRLIRTKKFEATIRYEVIARLNQMLNRPPLDMGVNIKMDNLLTIAEIENQEKILKNGNVTFKEVFDVLKI